MIEDAVLRTIERHKMFAPDQRVGVAVSGGADSVCLLHILHQLAPQWNLRLSVIHVDHCIRGAASQADAEFVRTLAAEFALPFHFRRVDVGAAGGNLEQEARRARNIFFLELLGSGKLDRVATGHTRSDQSETVLYRFLRGSGPAGLAGIRPTIDDGIVRPLLYITRHDIRQWLEARTIVWRQDETNFDPSYARNRIRHELLPLLRRDFNPNVDETLANMAEIARDEDDYWSSFPQAEARDVSIHELRKHPAIGRRAIRHAIESIKGDLRQIDFHHVEAVLDIARSANGHGRVHLPGVDVLRSFDRIRFSRPGENLEKQDYTLHLQPPCHVEIPGHAGNLDFQLIDRQGTSAPADTYDNLVTELDWQQLSIPPGGAEARHLELRNWRPGDQYRRVGQPHEQKLKLLFQETRVPIWQRRSWPVLTADGIIVWTRSFGPAAHYAAAATARTILRITDDFPPDA